MKVSEYADAAALSGTELLPVVQGGVTKKATASAIAGARTPVTIFVPVEIYNATLGSPGAFDTGTFATDGADLSFSITGRSSRVAVADDVIITFNGDTTNANYYQTQLDAADTTGPVSEGANRNISALPGTTGLANAPGVFRCSILDYANTTFHKLMISDSGFQQSSTTLNRIITSLAWLSASAIARIQAVPANGDFVTGSIMRVYKWKNLTVLT